ncbi:ComEA family DNA-binding protein [Melioribacter sp. OK-6-Me]|uniref:ComEA family DNA-binding protein n=1 Tax=unclassified Melioribacter TaxID=2627329 RepID=UPI003ED9DAE9
MIIIFVLFNAFILKAQTDTTFEELLSQLIEDNLGELEESEIFDDIEELLDNPIDINTASLDDLLRIPALDRRKASAIIQYRQSHGSFKNKNELYLVPELNDLTARWISYFIKISSSAKSESIFSFSKIALRSRIQSDLQIRQAYIENKFAGNRLKSYNRLLYYGKYINAGFVTDKDPGEKSYTDFTSGFIELRTKTFLKKIIVGNYTVESGYGLILWSPYNYRKGNEVTVPISNFRSGSRPYKSSGEFGYFSGISTSLSAGIIEFLPFVSLKRIDASLDTTGNINSFKYDGYHRSLNELNSHSNTKEYAYGAVIKLKPSQSLTLGLTTVSYKYNRAINSVGSSRLQNHTINFSYGNPLFTISGESALYKNHLSSITSVLLTPLDNLKLSLSYRDYSPYFYSVMGNSFGERSNSTNEKGFYTSIDFKSRMGNFSFYYDIYYFPFVKGNFPAKGKDFLFVYQNKLSNTSKINLLYKNERAEMPSNEELYPRLVLNSRIRYRIELINYFKDRIRTKTRFELVRIKSSAIKENGYLVYQDLQLKPLNNITVYARILFFDSASYDSRIYAYENDLDGLMTNGLFYGEGIKWYLLLKYTLNGFSFSLKYSELYKPFERQLGSGYTEIEGHTDNRISFQFDYALK